MSHAPSTSQQLLLYALSIIAAWIVAFVALNLLALAMLAGTRYVTRPPVTPIAGGSQGQRGAALFRFYTALLFSCCFYYYVSVPLVVSVALGTVGGLFYAAIRIGRHPMALLALMAALFAVFVARRIIVAVVSGLRTGFGDGPPGRKLELARHPRLRELLDEVAARVGTRPMDSVYLVPSVDVGIAQRGSTLAQLRGTGERCLILGVALLDRLELPTLKAVLAHEYAHFLNHNSVSDGLTLLVERSIAKTIAGLRYDRARRWWNPPWLVFISLDRLFKNVRRGESRLSELRADRIAAAAYGMRSVSLSLRHTIAATVRYEERAHSIVSRYLRSHRRIDNLYRTDLEARIDSRRIGERIRERLARHGRDADEQSCTRDRLTFASVIEAVSAPPNGDREPAWSVFADREQCEREATEDFQETVDAWCRRGIPRDDTAPGEPSE